MGTQWDWPGDGYARAGTVWVYATRPRLDRFGRVRVPGPSGGPRRGRPGDDDDPLRASEPVRGIADPARQQRHHRRHVDLPVRPRRARHQAQHLRRPGGGGEPARPDDLLDGCDLVGLGQPGHPDLHHRRRRRAGLRRSRPRLRRQAVRRGGQGWRVPHDEPRGLHRSRAGRAVVEGDDRPDAGAGRRPLDLDVHDQRPRDRSADRWAARHVEHQQLRQRRSDPQRPRLQRGPPRPAAQPARARRGAGRTHGAAFRGRGRPRADHAAAGARHPHRAAAGSRGWRPARSTPCRSPPGRTSRRTPAPSWPRSPP